MYDTTGTVCIISQVACCTKSKLTFDIAVVVPYIATINACLGFIVPEILLLPLLMVRVKLFAK